MAVPDLKQANEQLLLAAIREQEDAEAARRLAAELEAAIAREKILASASMALMSSFDYRETIFKVPSLLVPTISDWCAIEIVGPEGELDHLAAAHLAERNAAMGPVTGREMDMMVSGGVIAERVMASQKPELRIGCSEAAENAPPGRPKTPFKIHSCLCVPVVARNEVLALIWLATWATGRELGPAEVRFGEELSRRAATALENSGLYHATKLAVRMRDDVLATVAHDLMNPLTAIRLSAASLLLPKPGTPVNEETFRLAGRIERSVESISYLVEQLTEMASVHTGQLKLHATQVDAAAIVESACDIADPLAAAKTQQLLRDLPSREVVVQCDAERVRRLLSNLIGNSIKFTPPGGSITVSARQVDSHVEISVEDDGIGIPETDRDTIFGPYGRGSATDQPGKGLGLYIARGIAEAHGGTLAFDSARVAGSRFVLTLPISQNPPASIP